MSSRKHFGNAKHGAGRKPRYKEFRMGPLPDDFLGHTTDSLAQHFLAHPKYHNGMLLDKNLTWKERDLHKLRVLCEAESDIEASSTALGRPATALAHRASEVGFTLPVAWAKLIRPAYIRHPRDPSVVLAYPFIVKKRPEHADILRAYALVPKGYSPDVRADICQNVMLALYEGTVTLDDLERNKDKMRYFVAKFYRDQRPREELTGIGGEDDERPYYDIGWERDEDEANERRSLWAGWLSQMKPTPATQISSLYNREVGQTAGSAVAKGGSLAVEEVRAMIEADEWDGEIMTWATHNSSHALDRALERFGIKGSMKLVDEIREFCRDKRPKAFSGSEEIHDIKVKGARMRCIYNRDRHFILTLLPAGGYFAGPSYDGH